MFCGPPLGSLCLCILGISGHKTKCVRWLHCTCKVVPKKLAGRCQKLCERKERASAAQGRREVKVSKGFMAALLLADKTNVKISDWRDKTRPSCFFASTREAPARHPPFCHRMSLAMALLPQHTLSLDMARTPLALTTLRKPLLCFSQTGQPKLVSALRTQKSAQVPRKCGPRTQSRAKRTTPMGLCMMLAEKLPVDSAK